MICVPLKPVDQGALSEGRSKEREVFQLVNRLRDSALWHDNRRWLAQTVWYWDPVNGNDNNSGASATEAILTHEEFYHRTVGLRYTSSVIVNVLDDIPDQTFRVGHEAPSVYYQAVLTPIGTGTITSRTALNKAGNQPWEITDSAIPASWTASGYLHKYLVARNGSGTVVGTAWIDKDLGAKTVRMGPPSVTQPLLTAGSSTAVAQFGTTDGTFTAGNTYTVYDMKECALTSAFFNNRTVYFYGFNFTGSSGFNNNSSSSLCAMSNCVFTGSAGLTGRYGAYQCLFLSTAFFTFVSYSPFYNCIFHGNTDFVRSKAFFLQKNAYITNGGTLEMKQHCDGGYWGEYGDIAIFDAASAGFRVAHQSAWQSGLIWGTDNTNAGELVTVGTANNWLIAQSTPVAVSGSATDFAVGGVAYVWADLDVTNTTGSGFVVAGD